MEIFTKDGDIKAYGFYAVVAVAFLAICYVSYEGVNVRNKALETQNNLQKVQKETRESSELFSKLETIRKNEITIEKNDKKNEELKMEINTIAKDLPKYGIESKSRYIN